VSGKVVAQIKNLDQKDDATRYERHRWGEVHQGFVKKSGIFRRTILAWPTPVSKWFWTKLPVKQAGAGLPRPYGAALQILQV
jgi:hypothetical protein